MKSWDILLIILRSIMALILVIGLMFLGVKVGLRRFLLSIISIVSIALIVILSSVFLGTLKRMVEPWLSPIVSVPLVLGYIVYSILFPAVKMGFLVESALEPISEEGSRSLGAALGLVIALLTIRFVVFPIGAN